MSISQAHGEDKIEQNAIDRVGALDSETLTQQALSEEVKEKEVTWLEVQYSEEDEIRSVLALTLKPKIPQAQGAVLLLHDKGQHADWPDVIGPLRKSLPNNGWYTLSLSLPHDRRVETPERSLSPKAVEKISVTPAQKLSIRAASSRGSSSGKENSSGVADQPASSESQEENQSQDSGDQSEPVDIDLADKKQKEPKLTAEERADIHIKAGMDHLRNNGYQNIIIVAYRAASNLALNHIKDKATNIPSKGFAMVLVDPVLSPDYQDDLSQALGVGFKAPIMDIYFNSDIDVRELASERSASANVAKASRYMQVSLVANEPSLLQASLIRRIRFWLEKYAPGMSARKVSR